MDIAIVGAGWYGCHIATTLETLGMRVKVFERNSRLFHEASGNNQFRLHQGFHYARHHTTRVQSRDGFMRFLERYPTLSIGVASNIYAVPKAESTMDFATYRLIMTATGVDFSEIASVPFRLDHVAGLMNTGERVLMTSRARHYFQSRLSNVLNLSTRVESVVDHGSHVDVEGERFDYVIDSTWGHLHRPVADIFYEPTLLLYYEGPSDFPPLTFVDGDLCSLYPTEDPGIFTLSSVLHTPVGRFATAEEARTRRAEIDADLIDGKRQVMEAQITRYLPDFAGLFKFVAPQFAIKTKPVGAHDDRSCSVTRRGRVFSVMSGKIDTIFVAMERIIALLEMNEAQRFHGPASTLRVEIMGANA